MPKNQIIYNQEAVFIGPTPSSGSHFYSGFGGYVNLLQPLDRIQSAQYSFTEGRTDVKSIGNYGTISRPTLITPYSVNLSLSYLIMGLSNEASLGLNFNYPSGNQSNNPPYYGTGNVFPFSGFLNRTDYQQDCKNIFIVTNNGFDDFNLLPYVTGNDRTRMIKDNIYNYAFGDCYLDSYKVSAAVGDFPRAEVGFSCYNILYYSGGSGLTIPALNPKDNSLVTGKKFNIPPYNTGATSTVLLPGDIHCTITEANGANCQNLPIDFNDIKIQSFDLDVGLNREPLINLGYKLPMDRRINSPIYTNLNFSSIVGDSLTGSFIDYITNDTSYNVDIKMDFHRNQPFTGTAIHYKFRNIKFNNLSISDSISPRRLANFSLTSESKPNDLVNGFFISGQLGKSYNNPIFSGDTSNLVPPTNFLLSGTGVSYSEIDLNWTPSYSFFPIKYDLFRGTGINFNPGATVAIVSNLTSLNYNDVGLESDTTYYYYALVYDTKGLYTLSNEASGTTFHHPPIISGLSPSNIIMETSITPFSITVSGRYFTNIGNEIFYLSGKTPATSYYGNIATGNINYINNRLIQISITGINDWGIGSVYSSNYINNYGSSNNDIIFYITGCNSPLISGFSPQNINCSNQTGFILNIYGNNFTNHGNETLKIKYSSNIINANYIIYNSNTHILGIFPTGCSYPTGNYNVIYQNNCDSGLLTGLFITGYCLDCNGSFIPPGCPNIGIVPCLNPTGYDCCGKLDQLNSGDIGSWVSVTLSGCLNWNTNISEFSYNCKTFLSQYSHSGNFGGSCGHPNTPVFFYDIIRTN